MATSTSNIPVLQSYDQYLGDLLAAYLSETGINDLNVGSAVTSFFEAVALTTARASGDAIQILTDNSVDRATGDSLQRIAADEGITPIAAQVANGVVTIVDTSFQVISTTIYSGQPAPNIGSIIIYVSDASQIATYFAANPLNTNIYIGRGTQNSEGPLNVNGVTQIGSYWSISLNPSNPTTRYHNNNESVILAQGGVRTIPINTVVQAPASGASATILFSVTTQAIILDGATTVQNVQVAAQQIGTQGNVPAGGISQFASAPYANLTVTNPLPFTNGRNTQTDDQLRAQIKLARQSIGFGTALAIQNSVIGASSPSEGDTVIADSIVTQGGITTLYIDNGSTYEEKTQGVGIEDLIDHAFGGELYFQLQCNGNQTSIAKAFLQSSLVAPFNLQGGEQLSVIVGQIASTHTFVASDFLSPGAATAYEIVASINGDTSLLYNATTGDGGTTVVIRANAESHDSLLIGPVVGVDAAPLIGFQSNLAQTLLLYKNDILLNKDGLLAEVVGEPQSSWATFANTPVTLRIAVDGTPMVTYTITNQDFINEGTYTIVSNANSLASWVNVINALVPGITASQLGTSIQLVSNKGFSSVAEINIDPTSDLVTNGVLNINDLLSIGANSDYTLSRNTAQITLTKPLIAGDSLSAGIYFTEGTVNGTNISGGSLTIGSTDGGVLSQSIWLVYDDLTAKMIPSNISNNAVLTVSKPQANTVRYTAPVGVFPFYRIAVGDYAILWSYQLGLTNRFEARISAIDVAFNWFEIVVTAAEWAAVTTGAQAAYQDGIYFIRTQNVPQRFVLAPGLYTSLSTVAQDLQSQTDSALFSVTNNTYFSISTITKAITGSILIASVTGDMASLGFTVGQTSNNTTSLIAFYESSYQDGQYPSFIKTNFITTGAVANPPTSYINGVNEMTSALDLTTLGTNGTFAINPNYTLSSLEPFGAVLDTLSPGENTFLRDFAAGGGLTLQDDQFIKRFRVQSTVPGVKATFTLGGNVFTAVDFGTIGNTIVLVFDGIKTVATVTAAWNLANPTNQVTFTGSGATVPTIQTIELVGGVNGNYADRFFLAEPLTFGASEKLVVVLNNDPVNESFVMPMFRNVTVNATAPSSNTQFRAYDTGNAPLAPFVGARVGAIPAGVFNGVPSFPFDNYKVLMQAKNVLVQYNYTFPTPVPAVPVVTANTAILFRAVQWDQSGEYIDIAYNYPSVPNATLSNVVTVNNEVNISITLASGSLAVTPIVATTKWNITRTVNVGYDTITYATTPAITISPPVLAGYYVNIPAGSEIEASNTGTFLVVAVGASQFSINVPTGAGFVQSGVMGGLIQFYPAIPVTAKQIVAYVNSNTGLSSVVTASLATTGISNDGSGIVSLSTFDNSSFVLPFMELTDGVNWIYSSNISAIAPAPQFILKRPLNLIAATGYSFFTPGEPLQFVPTDIAQIQQFENVLGVSGISNSGTVNLVEDGKKIEIATDILGGSGAVQIVGGSGNAAYATVLNSSNTVLNQYINTFVSQPNLLGFTSNQLVQVTATNKQNKELLLIGDETVTVTANSPIAGYSTVTLQAPTLTDLTERRFGIPRTNEFTRGRSFRIEKHGLLTCLSWDGLNGSNPLFSSVANTHYTAGDTVSIVQSGGTTTYTIASGTTNFTQVSIGDLVTISASSSFFPSNIGTFLVTGVSFDGTVLQVENPNGISQSLVDSYTLVTNIVGGDTFTVNAIVLTAGTDFAVGGTIAISAQNLSDAIRAIGITASVTSSHSATVVYVISTSAIAPVISTTSVHVTTASGVFFPVGDGVNSFFSIPKSIEEGDNLQIKPNLLVPSNSFAVENQGTFRVIRRNISPTQSLQNALYYYNPSSVEETHLIANDFIYDGTGSTFTAHNVNNYLVLTWTGTGTNPTVQYPFSNTAPFNVVVGDEVVLGAQFTGNVGSWTIVGIDPIANTLTLMNPSAVNVAGTITVTSNNLLIHHNEIVASEYDATMTNDTLNISSNFLGTANQGQWVIDRVLNENTVMIDHILDTTSAITLGTNVPNFNVIERTPYVGYKYIEMVTANPLASQEGILVFNSRFQADKIKAPAGVSISALAKMGFNTNIIYGTNSYNYDTGLLQVCNQIVYGDPRDTITYPGVAAAGAEIYIKPPLDLRISLSIDVMINTGVSFQNMVTTVRTNVASLINSNPVGQSIAISAIIAAVNQIPGVFAVAISSPVYGPLTSTIFVPPSAKARILNLTDISVNQIT